MPEIELRHGAPQYVVHRADLQRALLEEAKTVADVRVNSKVVDIDFAGSSVTLRDGTTLQADVIVGADGKTSMTSTVVTLTFMLGMKSMCRMLMYRHLGLTDKTRPTGDAAFRAMIPLNAVTDPGLRTFVTEPIATRWMGPKRHVQGYPVRHGSLYNLVSGCILDDSVPCRL